MSGIEVVAAVSAIISAFHGGSELLKHVKAKRRRVRQVRQLQQEQEEKKLEDSLESGEQQIGFRWAQDEREYGDLIRIGDVRARDQLQHITILMQGEVIKSLQMALQCDNAVVNLTMLYQASITNRTATFDTLDELKQRLLPRMPISRQLRGGPEPTSNYHSSSLLATAGPSTFDPTRYIPDNYIPTAVTLTSQQDGKNLDRGLAKFFRDTKPDRNVQQESALAPARHSQASNDINFSQALQHLLNERGGEDPATLMKEIDEIRDSFHGLQISQRQSDPWTSTSSAYGYDGRRENHHRLSAQDAYSYDPLTPTREGLQMPKNMPPTPEEPGSRIYAPPPPAFNNAIFDQQNEQLRYHQQYAAKIPYPPHLQTQAPNQRHWSTTSGTSSNYSDAQSLERNGSTSSQESRTQNSHGSLNHSSPPLPQNSSPRNTTSNVPRNPSSPDMTFQYHDYQTFHQPSQANQGQSAPYHPHSPTPPFAPSFPQHSRGQSNAPLYIAPQSPAEDYTSLRYSPYAPPYPKPQQPSNAPPAPPTEQQPYLDEDMDPNAPNHRPGRLHILPLVARQPPPIPPAPDSYSSSRHTITQAVLPASALGTAPATAGLRHPSIAASIASTDSSASLPNGPKKPLRTGSIQSPPPGLMQTGRPCKANNYWGFCKGSYDIRHDPKKGLNLRTQPLGMYATREIWECNACTFKGSTFLAPHPTKKKKEITIVDPRPYTSESGVRYKWIFLAKSHVKKKAGDSHAEESNYGCMFCSLMDEVSSIYGGVETLMNHIKTVHGAKEMNEGIKKKAKAVVGRMPEKGEEWDICVPLGGSLEELP